MIIWRVARIEMLMLTKPNFRCTKCPISILYENYNGLQKNLIFLQIQHIQSIKRREGGKTTEYFRLIISIELALNNFWDFTKSDYFVVSHRIKHSRQYNRSKCKNLSFVQYILSIPWNRSNYVKYLVYGTHSLSNWPNENIPLDREEHRNLCENVHRVSKRKNKNRNNKIHVIFPNPSANKPNNNNSE